MDANHAVTPDESNLATKLVEGFRSPVAQHRIRQVTLPLSAITAVIRSSLEQSRFFPPGARPEELGDGAVIECRGEDDFRVYERFEVGQLRYSEVSSRSYRSLQRAVSRYLQHYGPLLRVDGVHITGWP